MEITTFTDFEGKEHIIITREDGSKESMLKSTYDEMQAQQLGGN